MTDPLINFFIHTDFGHDPDDAIALAYLIEHGKIPDAIGVTPGHLQQLESLEGFLESYKLNTPIFRSREPEWNNNFTTGKHKIFNQNTLPVATTYNEIDKVQVKEALIIGPPKNLGPVLQCDSLYFQGGYSPNSIKPLDKFKGLQAVPSFNPGGSKNDFNQILDNQNIYAKRFIGKNVCHGFTKADLIDKFNWEPKNKVVKKFWDKLEPTKAMHDVLAAIMLMRSDLGVWNQEKPCWYDSNKLTTVPTEENIYTLIGLRI